MATKRIPLKRAIRSRITDQATAAFRLCEEIRAAGDDELFEESGGRRNEFLEAELRLARLLGLKPWHESPLAATTEEPPAWMKDQFSIANWKHAREVRAAVAAALAAQGKKPQ